MGDNDKKYLVYATLIFVSWNLQTSDSGYSPRIEDAMDTAAASPPVKAKCTPEEKKGSMKARKERKNGLLNS
jgi:hypothetical protein